MIIFLGTLTDDDNLALLPSEVMHCSKILRKQVGDEITVHDGQGNVYIGQINFISKSEITAVKLRQTTYEKPIALHLAIALTKNADRTEWLVSKVTEIGATHITFLKCERSVKHKFRYERMSKIIKSATKQSLKKWYPQLSKDCLTFQEFISSVSNGQANKFIASYDESNNHLLNTRISNSPTYILIGPEGDFTEQESALAIAKGFTSVNLGSERLRTETAGLYSISLLKAMLDLKV